MSLRLLVSLWLAVALFAATPVAGAGSRSHPYVTLEEGRIGKYPWAVRVRRPEGRAGVGPHGAQRPFLAVGVEEPPTVAPIEEGMIFGGHSLFPGRLTASGEPLIVTNLGFDWATVRMTAVGIAFAPAVRRIELTGCDGSHESIRLHELNSTQARKARLERFRYLAFAVRGSWCYEEMTSFSAKGVELWESNSGR